MAACTSTPDKVDQQQQREDELYKAKLCEQAERFDEMAECMKSVVSLQPELSVDERNFLSVAYKNVIGLRRSSWRILSSIQKKEEAKAETQVNLQIVNDYKSTVEKELKGICDEIIHLLDKLLIPAATVPESKVFFYKMKGDYHRYMAEFSGDEVRQRAADESLEAYQTASEIATVELAPTHPIRLGLALNFSVFYFEILGAADRACALAKSAFDEAIAELDTLSEESYKDSTLIMQLLRDNLTLWTADGITGEEGEGGGKEKKENETSVGGSSPPVQSVTDG